jgi:hypothetical protein
MERLLISASSYFGIGETLPQMLGVQEGVVEVKRRYPVGHPEKYHHE